MCNQNLLQERALFMLAHLNFDFVFRIAEQKIALLEHFCVVIVVMSVAFYLTGIGKGLDSIELLQNGSYMLLVTS